MTPRNRLSTGWAPLSLALGLGLGATACVDSATQPATDPGLPVARAEVTGSAGLTPLEQLGREIYFDARLSLRMNQSCATCHAPDFGFTGPIPGVNLLGSVYRGSVASRAGARKPPSAAYATLSPVFHYDAVEDVYVGGNFWDGRATGAKLGNPAADQAQGPFLNPVEQALPDLACVVYRVLEGSYGSLYDVVWGPPGLEEIDFPKNTDKLCRKEGITVDLSESDRADVLTAYDRIGLSIAAFEGSTDVNAFTSKYDAYLAGEVELTPDEMDGLELFEGKAMCSACHPSEGAGALFTDFTFDNLGVPANPLNPIYATDPGFVDPGLGGFLESIGDPGYASFYGAHKVPTLRNVAKAPGEAYKAYMHNGVFKTLEQVVHFYNTRDALRPCGIGEVSPTAAGLLMMGTMPECWPAPEVSDNMNVDELGNLGLTAEEEAKIVAFMKTLSDGWR